ncbi:hypothetical protein AB0C96_39265 [Streptomyces sp. NPDC048506]|uniref:hypothetical protein n=1 Tax=Streptomyces sp. NPDC048506 TaxID=3155028 RepID=UPI003431C956
MPAESLSRWVRTGLFAAVCVALSAAGHAMMSGSDVAPSALAAAFLATGVGAWVAAGRERGPVAIVGGLLGVQVMLHQLFAWAQQRPVALTMRMPMGTDMGTDMGVGMGMTHVQVQTHMGTGSSAVVHGGHSSLGMVAGHGVAAVVCGLWLWWGETAVFRLLRCLGMVAVWAVGSLRLLTVCFVGPVRRPSPWAGSRAELPVARLRAALLCHVQSRRGPPRELAYP